MLFDDTDDKEHLRLAYPYSSAEPLRFEPTGSYAVPDSDYKGVEYGWNHTMGEIINSLIGAGLRIEFLHEHHVSVDGGTFRALEPTENGWFRLKDPVERAAIPLMFSIRAHKPA